MLHPLTETLDWQPLMEAGTRPSRYLKRAPNIIIYAMDKIIAIRRVILQDHHHFPGRTRHYVQAGPDARTEFPPFKSLAITIHPEDSGFYLMHVTEKGDCADTWHETLDEAFHQAEWEFGVRRDEWLEVNEPF
jgi:hypothetical protein